MEYIAYNPFKHKMPDDWVYVYTRPNVPVRYGRANSKYENLTGSTSPDCEKVMLLNSNLIKAIDYLIKQKQGEQ